jgi:malonyl-CoA O-methyltransferase
VVAVDFSQAMMARARAKPGIDNVAFAVADLTRPWPLTDRYADLVACNLVLEHIENLSFVFSEASRCLVERGCFFVSELHPFRQYQGTKANFQRDQETTEIPAFVHHISDFLNAAKSSGFALKHLKEWWHAQDQDKPPRLVSFWFEKQNSPR